MKKFVFFILIILFVLPLTAQEESPDVRSGNKMYKAEKFTDAEVAYRKGLEKNPKSFEANYNLGNALYRQGKYNEALEQYKTSLALQPDQKTKVASALHNAGNALLNEKKIEESIAAYKMALKANPKDNGTRYNLAYAQTLLQKQQQNKDQDKKDQQEKQEQEQKEQEQKEQDQQNQQPPPTKQPEMSKENAQQILDALMQDEKNTLDKAKKQNVRSRRSADKDW
ncbi:MAG: tetratricopeptide repeat protein [Paludibacteraceae bacterium]|nr:tetratricopeptide repeat protein [Paludibacteraceae bacterium]